MFLKFIQQHFFSGYSLLKNNVKILLISALFVVGFAIVEYLLLLENNRSVKYSDCTAYNCTVKQLDQSLLAQKGNVLQSTCTEPSSGCGSNYYWDPGSCMCKQNQTTGCQPPSAGCGGNYYWNTGSCSCQPYQTTCQAPSGGCSSGSTWDSSTCSCRTCQMPSGGCGSGYWDQGACSCRTSTACSEPVSGCGSNYYWDSSSCMCKANQPTTTTACQAPSGGCGNNYYWDSLTCSCKSSCVSPSGGCGSGYYWSSSSCSCRPNPTPTTYTCQAPSAGCGSNYYWDSSSCMCKANQSTTTSCQAPIAGCGSNYYWDSSSCSCKYYAAPTVPSTTCQSPTGGCSSGYYWDSSSCSCRQNQTTTCQPPSVGCSSNQYWDYISCFCRTYSSCQAPSGGCQANYYWDTSSCACKASSACKPPSAGCGFNSYWDSYSCNCKSSNVCTAPTNGCGSSLYWDYFSCSCRSDTPTGGTAACQPSVSGCGANSYWDSASCSCKAATTCSAPLMGCDAAFLWDQSSCSCRPKDTVALCKTPTGGCGEGWYWDQPLCACRSYSDSHAFYSTVYSTYTAETRYDRLSYEPPERLLCLKALLSEADYSKLRYFVTTNPQEEENIKQLGEKVKQCWGETKSSDTDTLATNRTPIENEACLKEAIGEAAFKEIYVQNRQPTYEEHIKFARCYTKVSSISVNYFTNNQQIPKVIEDCLKKTLTGKLYEQVKTGKESVPHELNEAINGCFGVSYQPFEQGQSYKIPDEIKNCLAENIGEERIVAINKGQQPTGEEMKKADSCFAKLNSIQTQFLPPPPEQVAFIKTDTNSVQLAEIKQDTQTEDNQTYGGKIKFSGKGLPDSTVTIYIFSDPIVVTTKTDANGDWIYEMNKPLTGEKHTAYATVKNSSGNLVRSEVFDFTVIAAETDINRPLLNESKTSEKTQTNFLLVAFIGIGAATMIVFLIYTFVLSSKLRKIEREEELKSVNDQEGV